MFRDARLNGNVAALFALVGRVIILEDCITDLRYHAVLRATQEAESHVPAISTHVVSKQNQPGFGSQLARHYRTGESKEHLAIEIE